MGSFLRALVSPVTKIVEGYQNRKLEEQKAEATVERILTEASASNAEVAGQIALVNAKNQNSTWKDEYALLVISGPVLIGMFSGILEALGFSEKGTTNALMVAMMSPLSLLPEYWQQTFQVGMLSALGVNIWNKARKI